MSEPNFEVGTQWEARCCLINIFNRSTVQAPQGSMYMIPLDPVSLAWVWFSELVRSQGSCHPNFLMTFGKWTHARRRLAWVHGSAACIVAWAHFRKMDPCRTEACMGPPQLGLLCGTALPGALFSRKNRSPVFCSLKLCFLHLLRQYSRGLG